MPVGIWHVRQFPVFPVPTDGKPWARCLRGEIRSSDVLHGKIKKINYY